MAWDVDGRASQSFFILTDHDRMLMASYHPSCAQYSLRHPLQRRMNYWLTGGTIIGPIHLFWADQALIQRMNLYLEDYLGSSECSGLRLLIFIHFLKTLIYYLDLSLLS